MKTIKEQNGFKIVFNGGHTYMVIDSNGDCWSATDTLRKANNKLNKILNDSGLA